MFAISHGESQRFSMVYRRILEWPDKKLNCVSRDFNFDSDLEIAKDLLDTFNVSGGYGLSAPQIGFNVNVIVINEKILSEKEGCSESLLMINPTFSFLSSKNKAPESCFSLPWLSVEVERFSEIEVFWKNLDGEEYSKKFSGLTAACIQHEIDHLNGILTIDKLSQLRKNRIIKKVSKIKSSRNQTSQKEKEEKSKIKSLKTRKRKRLLRKGKKK